MATEDTAGPGSRVAGIVCSLWVLVLGPSVLALEGRKEGRQEWCPVGGSGVQEWQY